MKKRYLEIGKIVSTHGVQGEMRIQPWSDSPDFLTQFGAFYLNAEGTEKLDVKSCRPHGNIVLLRAAGVDTLEQAADLRGQVLYMDKSDVQLQPGVYFVQDLIGCRVLDEETEDEYGVISEVSKTGANDVWHVKTPEGTQVLIPNIPDVVKSVDIEAGIIKIHALKGLFDDAD